MNTNPYRVYQGRGKKHHP